MNRHTTFIANIYGQYTPLRGIYHKLDLKLGWRFRNAPITWLTDAASTPAPTI